MKFLKCFLLMIFLSLPLLIFSMEAVLKSTKSPQYYLSICAIFQDEELYLKEWIEFHHLLGVEHFYLYNNDSQDNYQNVLSPYISKGIVELIDWPSPEKGKNWMPEQKKAYEHCLKKCEEVSAWLAIIDVDEFIVPVIAPDLTSFLQAYDHRPEIGAIKINWQLYGTAWVASLAKNQLLIESLMLKAPTNYHSSTVPHNEVIKCIVRPQAVKHYRIHEGDLKEGYFALPEGGNKRFQKVQIDQIRINHYWTRTEDFFYDVKIGRRLRCHNKEYLSSMEQKRFDLNQVEDRIMERFIPQMQKIMNMQ